MQKWCVFHKINLFMRSLAFYIFLFIAAIIYSSIILLLFPFPLTCRFAVVIAFTRAQMLALRVLCNIHYSIEGVEHIPQDRNGVALSKHQSTWETFFLPGLFKAPAIITKRELLWIPFFGWAFASVEPIAINRSDQSTAMDQVISQGKKYLEQGRWVLVFPEGTRMRAGEVGKYRLGGARLAIAAGHYPVLPIAHNAGYFWGKNIFIKKPGTIRVVIDPLIETHGCTPEEVTQQAKNWIESTLLKFEKEPHNEYTKF